MLIFADKKKQSHTTKGLIKNAEFEPTSEVAGAGSSKAATRALRLVPSTRGAGGAACLLGAA